LNQLNDRQRGASVCDTTPLIEKLVKGDLRNG